MTERTLQERDRLTRLETTLNTYDAELQEHKEECLLVRQETNSKLNLLGKTIESNHEEWKKVVSRMDEGNIKRLRTANGLLITILLAVLGFVGSQAWAHIFK